MPCAPAGPREGTPLTDAPADPVRAPVPQSARPPHGALPTVSATPAAVGSPPPGCGPRPHGPLALHYALQTAGYAGVVALFVALPAARRLGSSGAMQRLGVVSFSLYLVHEPVVVAVASLGPSSLPVKLALATPVALVAAVLFHAAVEGPSHRLSQRVGRRLQRSPDGTP